LVLEETDDEVIDGVWYIKEEELGGKSKVPYSIKCFVEVE